MNRYCGSCGAFVDDPWMEHPCPMYREEPPLPEGDPDFRVIPERSADELQAALDRYRRTVNRE